MRRIALDLPPSVRKPGLSTRLVLGTIAGVVGTAAMTGAMRWLHQRLPLDEQYPLPPREITERVARRIAPDLHESDLRQASLLAHYAYGALTGALLSAFAPNVSTAKGGAYGIAVWIASYLGWAPAARILKPAYRHPLRRNALMIGVHALWGVVTASTLQDMGDARRTMLRSGELRDARVTGDSDGSTDNVR